MIALFLALTLSGTAPTNADTAYSTIVVRPHQTISWLSFRYLGTYDAKTSDTLKMDNPAISDLGHLKGGETLRLRRSMDRRSLSPERQIALASRQAVVTTLKGSGEIRRANGQILPLSVNTFLATGDEVRTGAGTSAEVVVDNQSVLRMRENSRLRLQGIQDTTLAQGRSAGTRVALDAGSLWVKVRTWAGPLVGFEVRLPSTIAGVHGTVFETSIKADGSEEVLVREGVVSVRELRENGPEVRLMKGQSVSTQAGVLQVPAPAKASPAKWPAEFKDTESPDSPASDIPETMGKPGHPVDPAADQSRHQDLRKSIQTHTKKPKPIECPGGA